MSIDEKFEDNLPQGEFYGPIFIIEQRENHGFGYHTHLSFLINGKYIRTGYAITFRGGEFLIYEHGKKKPLFDIRDKKRAVLKDIKENLETVFRGISHMNLVKPPKDCQSLYKPLS